MMVRWLAALTLVLWCRGSQAAQIKIPANSFLNVVQTDFPQVRHPLSAPIPCRDGGLSSWRRPLWTGLRGQGSCAEAA